MHASDHSFIGGLAHELGVNGHQIANHSLVGSEDRDSQDESLVCSLDRLPPRPGIVVVEHSPGMWEVGLILGHLKQKFEVLLLCLALNIKELESDWPAESQDNGLGWDITAYLWRGV